MNDELAQSFGEVFTRSRADDEIVAVPHSHGLLGSVRLLASLAMARDQEAPCHHPLTYSSAAYNLTENASDLQYGYFIILNKKIILFVMDNDLLDRGGKPAIIGHLHEASPALRGETGTHILADEH